MLGDIFHSSPRIVGRPSRFLRGEPITNGAVVRQGYRCICLLVPFILELLNQDPLLRQFLALRFQFPALCLQLLLLLQQ